MTARQLVGTVGANGWTEEAANALDLPPDAIREAIRYDDANRELLAWDSSASLRVLAWGSAGDFGGTSPGR